MLWTPQKPLTSMHRYNHKHLPVTKKGSPYSITERRVPELIPVLGSQVSLQVM